MKPLHLAFIALIDLIWGLNAIAIKLSVDAVQPLAAVFARYLIVLIVCLPWLRWLPGRMTLLLSTAVVAGPVCFGLGALGYSLADNVSALAIAGQLSVPFSLVLAVLFDGERIHWPRMTGILLAFLGVVVMGFDPAIAREGIGLVLTVVGVFFYGAAMLLFRRLKGVPPLTIHAWIALVSIPLMAAGSAVFEPGGLARLPHLSGTVLGWLAFSAIGASVIGHAGISWLFQRYPVGMVSPLTLPTPLISVIIAVVMLHNPLTPQLIAGGILTLVGTAIITLRTARAMEVAPA